MGVTVFSTRDVAAEIILLLEERRIPVGNLDEIFGIVKETALYFTPVGHGPVGIPDEEYQKISEELKNKLKNRAAHD